MKTTALLLSITIIGGSLAYVIWQNWKPNKITAHSIDNIAPAKYITLYGAVSCICTADNSIRRSKDIFDHYTTPGISLDTIQNVLYGTVTGTCISRPKTTRVQKRMLKIVDSIYRNNK